MLILLPPSEGKVAPARRGRPVDLETLSSPALTEARQAVLGALIEISGRDDAADILKVGPQQLLEVRQNLDLRRLPARPALEVYTGVLYAALAAATLPTAARRRANRAIRVQSALWGPIGPSDRIPPYRLSMATTLPGVGPLAGHWRRAIAAAQDVDPGSTAIGRRADSVIVDCRSSSYAAAWRGNREQAERMVAVRVLSDVNGRLTVVSHLAKHTRGEVARALLLAERTPKSAADVAEVVGRSHRCALQPERTGWRLDVITEPASSSAEADRVRAQG